MYLYILLSIFAVLFIIQICFYLIPYTGILRHCYAERKGKIKHSEAKPPVSIIICAKNESINLQQFLPLVLEQNYPDYEVIIINDGSWDDTVDVIERFQKLYSNLYITNIPGDTRILSHKKLAITIGVKAAKNEILLFTDADCRPLTPDWISKMVRNFDDDTEFVLGHGNYYQKKGFIRKMVSYDTLFIAMQYMGFAKLGYSYMGVGRNLAYRKSTFMNMKGFAGFLNVASGDDDLLINAFGNKNNTKIEPNLSAETLSLPKETFKEWYYQKKRHLSTTTAYKTDSKLFLGIEPLTRGLFYLGAIILIVLGYNNMIVLISTISAVILRYIVQAVVINLTAKQYKDKPFGISIILFDIILPLITLYILTVGKLFSRRKNNIW